MDVTAVNLLALAVAAIARVAAGAAWRAAGRDRARVEALAGQVAQGREALAAAQGEIAGAKQEIATLSADAREAMIALMERVEALERHLAPLTTDLEDVIGRADGLDGRLQALEGRLRDVASTPPPPPIPSGRRGGRLEELRAVLRAQAGEAMGVKETLANEPPASDTLGHEGHERPEM